jgi:hypothetical protein
MTAVVLSPATYHTPAGWAQRCTLRDDTAAHQIRLSFVHADRGITQHVVVSCTCRRSVPKPGSTRRNPGFDPIATITTADEAWTAWHTFHKESDR